MKFMRNPWRKGFIVCELHITEYEYLKNYFFEMSSREGDVNFPPSEVRRRRFYEYYRDMLNFDHKRVVL